MISDEPEENLSSGEEDIEVPQEAAEDVFPELDAVQIEVGQVNISIDKYINILIIEDDEYIAKEYGFMLEAYGYNISYAFDPEQALKILYMNGNSFWLIVIDIRMKYGKYFSFETTVGGLKTGVLLSKEVADLSHDSIVIALTNSNDSMDEAWFSAKEGFVFCRKHIYTAPEFAKFVHKISLSDLDEALELYATKKFSEELRSDQVRTINYIANQTFTKDTTMGDKYEVKQAAAVGPNAHVHDNVFNQVWEQNKSNIDLSGLASQLENVREALAVNASSKEDFIEIGHVASAQQEAETGNGPKAMAYLKLTGKKTFEIAEKIGVAIAVAAIKASTGM